MKNLFFIPLVLINVLLFSSFELHAETSQEKVLNVKVEDKSQHKRLLGSSVKSAATIDLNGELALLYSQNNNIFFRLGDNEPVVISNEKTSEKGVWLHKNAKRLYALWWTKTEEGKQLKIKSSLDNGKTFSKDAKFVAKYGVLPVLSITDDGSDKIAIAYISEREPGYQVYFNRSVDGGETWFADDVRMNELYNNEGPVKGSEPLKEKQGRSHVSAPYLQYYGNRLVLVWQERAVIKNNRYLRILSKTSMDNGKTWSDDVEIYKQLAVKPQEMHVNKLGKELFISVLIPEKGLLTFSAANTFSKWEQLKIVPDTKALDTASSMHSSISSGRKILTFTSSRPSEKTKINVIVNEPESDSWNDITTSILGASRIVAKDKNNITKTTLSFVGSLADKTAIIVCEDHQYLLPTLHVNYSTDGGLTWLEEPALLAPPGKVQMKYPSMLQGDDSIWLTYTYMDYSKKGFKQALYGTKLAEITNERKVKINLPKEELVIKITEEEKIKRLKQRSREFWDLRVKQDYAATLEYFDPVYRSSFNKAGFASTQGKIQFLEAKVDDVTLDGNLGYVSTTLKVSLAMFMKEGGLLEEATPPKTRDVNARWGWFYDNWYLMPYSLFKRDYDY